jgi:hypothetical protein
VTRRKVFDSGTVPAVFWRREDVQVALARRDVGRLFTLYTEVFPDCTQTQLALMTEHDRSDISNWIRGRRQGRVSDIEVLTRIADGLRLPDQARVLLGLAPAKAIVSGLRSEHAAALLPGGTGRQAADEPSSAPPRLAICGSRAGDTDSEVIDAAIQALARLVLTRRCQVSHGPVGVGIEVMTYIADHYHPPGIAAAIAVFGHRNVVSAADLILVIGGGTGTQDEVDLALSMGKKIIAMPASGGTARRFHDQARRDPRLRTWISAASFAALDVTAQTARPGEEFVTIVEDLLDASLGEPDA